MNGYGVLVRVLLGCAVVSLLPACGGGDESTGGEVVMGQNGAVDVNTQGSFAVSMLAAVNAARASARSCGSETFAAAAPLTWNVLLTQSAAWYANDMAQKNYFNFDHTSSDGRSSHQRITDTGYLSSMTDENIAAGQSNINSVVNQWLASPGHCSAIMSASIKEIGAARASKSGTRYNHYWVLDFGAP